MAGLPETGIVDRVTLNKMVSPGCGKIAGNTASRTTSSPELFDRILVANDKQPTTNNFKGILKTPVAGFITTLY